MHLSLEGLYDCAPRGWQSKNTWDTLRPTNPVDKEWAVSCNVRM